MQDLVSIIMPSYNTARYIADSIRSVQAQTYGNWELLIVDDCSTDDTDGAVAPFLADGRIRYLKNAVNSGAAVSRNYALREAKGRWIAFLDSDDLWFPEKLERQLACMEETGCHFSYTDYRVCLNGQLQPYAVIGPDVVTRRKMRDYCYFSTITVIYDREYVGLIQIAPIRKNNDYAMWLQIIEKTPCYRFPEVLSCYMKHEGSISSGSKLKLIRWHYVLWHDAQHLDPVSAWVMTLRNLFWGVYKKLHYKKAIERTNEDDIV